MMGNFIVGGEILGMQGGLGKCSVYINKAEEVGKTFGKSNVERNFVGPFVL